MNRFILLIACCAFTAKVLGQSSVTYDFSHVSSQEWIMTETPYDGGEGYINSYATTYNPTPTNVTSNSLTLPGSVSSDDSGIDYYEISMNNSTSYLTSSSISKNITDLSPSTTYLVKGRAVRNLEQRSAWSDSRDVYTLYDIPETATYDADLTKSGSLVLQDKKEIRLLPGFRFKEIDGEYSMRTGLVAARASSYVYIPDPIFKAYLVGKNAINTDGDGEISYAEAEAYTGRMSVAKRRNTPDEKKISDLTGIEAFTGLTLLDCSYNLLTTLDVSANTALTSLSCRYNSLTALDVSANTALKTLSCFSNSLTALDVSANTALTRLSCTYNSLTALDVSANTALIALDCNSNSLTELDVSGATALAYLFCDRNSLRALDVSANTALRGLHCAYNDLTALDVSAHTALRVLNCYDNDLTTLDVSAIVNLYTLLAKKNPDLSCIQVADVAAAESKRRWRIDDHTSFSTKCTRTQYVYIPDPIFKAYLVGKNAINTDGDGEISYAEAEAYNGRMSVAKRRNTPDEEKISDLTGIEAFTGLTLLDCSYNLLTTLDVSTHTALTGLSCRYNSLTALDVSANTVLSVLNCSNNPLTALDVSANTALAYLHCTYNSLTALDVSANTALRVLDCSTNDLTALDVSGATALAYLFCYRNALTSLDISANTALTSLICSSNALTSLDVSANTALRNLSCFYNNLTALDISAIVNLWAMNTTENPNLSCIQVADVAAAESMRRWSIEGYTSYSTNCPDNSRQAGGRSAAVAADSGLEGEVTYGIHPNPADAVIHINLSEENVTRVVVVNAQGIVALDAHTPENHQVSLDVSGLIPGLYIIQVYTSQGLFFSQKQLIE